MTRFCLARGCLNLAATASEYCPKHEDAPASVNVPPHCYRCGAKRGLMQATLTAGGLTAPVLVCENVCGMANRDLPPHKIRAALRLDPE